MPTSNKPSIQKSALVLELSGRSWGDVAVAYYKKDTKWVEFARAEVVYYERPPGEYTIRASAPRDVKGSELEVVVCDAEHGLPPNEWTSDPVKF